MRPIALTAILLSSVACLTLTGCAREESAPTPPPAPGEARRRFVSDHLAHSSVDLSYRASPHDTRGVRDFYVILLSGPTRMEPLPHYADGTPAAAAVVVGPEGMAAVVDELAREGFFDTCTRLHSGWAVEPTVPPPADSRPYDPGLLVEHHPEGALEVRLAVSHDQWHHNFQHPYPLTHPTRDLLQRIVARLHPEARDPIEQGLLDKMR